MKQPTISQATPDQFSSMAALFEAQLQEHGIKSSTDALIALLRMVNDRPEYGFVLTAVYDGSIVGVAYATSLLSLEHGGWSGWLEELYVLPEWRGNGLGSCLLDAVIVGAIERGWIALDLEVDVGHQRVVSLYERRDFQSITRRRFVRHFRNEAKA